MKKIEKKALKLNIKTNMKYYINFELDKLQNLLNNDFNQC